MFLFPAAGHKCYLKETNTTIMIKSYHYSESGFAFFHSLMTSRKQPVKVVPWNYIQTCSNDHFHKMTTRLRQPVLSPPKPITIQQLVYKTTNCPTRPTTTFLFPKWKKNCLKQPLQNFIQQRNGKQCITNKCLSDHIYSIATLSCKICLMFIKSGHLHLT